MIIDLGTPEGQEFLEILTEPRPVCSNGLVPDPPKERLTPVPNRKARRARRKRH